MSQEATAFRAALHASPAGTRAFVFDVGANNGKWSRGWAPDVMAASAAAKRLEVHLFEPQRVFTAPLRALAAKYNFTFVNAAVGKADGQTMMQASFAGSKSASVVDAPSPHALPASAYPVRMLDLAGYLRERLPPTGALAYLKLDVEGLEYSLLPWLLTQGALCRLSHIRIEWHLAATPIPDRLEAVALRHSVGSLLRHGCEVPPRVIAHEEFAANNFAFPVPGLQELAAKHTRWSNAAHGGWHTSSWTQKVLLEDWKRLNRTQSAEDQIRCLRTPPACLDSCGAENLRCSWNESGAAWKRSAQVGFTARAVEERGLSMPPWSMVQMDTRMGKIDANVTLNV